MKNLFNKIILAVASVAFLGLLTGCNPEMDPTVLSLALKTVGPDYVEIAVEGGKDVIYVIDDEELDALIATDPNMIGMSEDKAKFASDGLWRIDNLQSDTKYYVYAVARHEAGFTKVATLQFTTIEYDFEELLTVLDTYYNGYKIHVNVPEEVKQANHALRYALSNIAVYKKIKNLYGTPDREMLLTNGGAHTRFLTKDHTFVIDDNNINWKDKDGNEVIDETTGDAEYFHDPIKPGEPVYFMVGEFEYGDGETLAGISGWGEGYFGALWEKTVEDLENSGTSQASVLFKGGMDVEEIKLQTFDNEQEDKGWTGKFQRKMFKVKEPSKLKANLDIKVENVSVVDADIKFTPDEDIYGYLYAIIDMPTYNAMLDLLDGRKDLLQWFLTSYLAYMELGVGLETEAISINAGSSFTTNHLNGRSTYKICVTALGDEEGTSQAYFEKEFKTNDLTKDIPIIQVTPVYKDGEQQMSDPFVATFNVKYMNREKAGDLKRCLWAADFKREWDKLKSSYVDVVGSNYLFKDEELAAICSEEGLNVSFPTLDGETMRMVVYGYNEEYEYNVIDSKGEDGGTDCPAIADYVSPYKPAKPTVSTTLFADLVGEWQASAKIINVDDNEEEIEVDYISRENIEISYGAPAYPENLFESVKDIYASMGISEDETKDYCDEFVKQSEEFGVNRVVNQNRLLCTGFIDFDYLHYGETPTQGRLDKFTPYDLFVDKGYNSVDVAQIFYDFGPKWFIEVDENGNAYVPFDPNTLVPTHVWGNYPNYLAACTDAASGYLATLSPRDDVKGFPVTVSADKNTITIGSVTMSDRDGKDQPILNEDGTQRKSEYYMNILGFQNESTVWVTPIVSEITLKRVQTPAPALAKSASLARKSSSGRPVSVRPTMGSVVLPEVPVYKDRSDVLKLDAAIKPVKYKKVDNPNIITMEDLDRAFENYYQRTVNRR